MFLHGALLGTTGGLLYARGMSRYLLLLSLSLLPWSAHAVICKSVDAKGGVSYSDVPAAECRHPVKLPEVSRYAPPPTGDSPLLPAEPAGVEGVGVASGYTEMRIEQPKAGGTVRSNEGKVPVAVYLQPALQRGHYLQLVLDGTPVGKPVASLGTTLSDVTPGTHSLSARVVDAEGRVLYSTGSIPFTLHREARETTTAPPSGDAFAPRYAPLPKNGNGFRPGPAGKPFQPTGKPDYSPPPAPDYKPGGAPIPQTPGGNNHPAFAPRYRP